MILYKPEYVYFNQEFHKNYGVLVEENLIHEVRPIREFDSSLENYEEELWEDMVLIPGTVNVHNHCFQSLLRGIAADRPFLEWRDKSLYHYSPKMTREDIYNGALLAFTEMMKRGVTTVCDFFYLHTFGTDSDEAVIEAAKDAGIRLVLARTMYDWKGAPKGYVETIEEAAVNTRTLHRKYKNSDMVTILPAPHSLHAATPEMIVAGHQLAKELGTRFHIHVAEEPFEVEEVKKAHGGLTALKYLDTLGVVDDSMVMVHGVWLTKEEIEIYGAKGGKLAYCPSSNMFLADGITDIPAMIKAGVAIGLGSDGACSNNRISVFEEMRMVSILQKAKTCDAMCLDYKQAFAMGTANGAEILQLPAGEIKKGYLADFVGIDLNDLSMMPLSENLEQMLPNLVYSMESTAVKMVVVGGRTTVKAHNLISIEEDMVRSKVKQTMRRLQKETK